VNLCAGEFLSARRIITFLWFWVECQQTESWWKMRLFWLVVFVSTLVLTVKGQGGYFCQSTPSGSCTSNCLMCSAGKYSQWSLTQCETMSPTTALCMDCAPGRFVQSSGQSMCTPCNPGTFSTGHGATVCTNCPAGGYQPNFGSSFCIPCPSGMYTTSDKSQCLSCASTTSCNNINPPRMVSSSVLHHATDPTQSVVVNVVFDQDVAFASIVVGSLSSVAREIRVISGVSTHPSQLSANYLSCTQLSAPGPSGSALEQVDASLGATLYDCSRSISSSSDLSVTATIHSSSVSVNIPSPLQPPGQNYRLTFTANTICSSSTSSTYVCSASLIDVAVAIPGLSLLVELE
jgi:hypothetical protein